MQVNLQPQRIIGGSRGLQRAILAINSGNLVAFPTETVYGLGADAKNNQAVAQIFKTKERPRFNPLIIHVLDDIEAKNLVYWNDAASKKAWRSKCTNSSWNSISRTCFFSIG